MKNLPEFLTIKEYAQYLRLNRNTVAKYVFTGKIPSILQKHPSPNGRPARTRLINKKELIALIT